jgi:hypothetical protein
MKKNVVTALWKRSELVAKLNVMGKNFRRNGGMSLMLKWMKLDGEKIKTIEYISDSYPFSKHYMKTAIKCCQTHGIRMGEGDMEHIAFTKENKFGWSKALTILAEEECQKMGRYARNEIKLQSALGIYTKPLLCSIGAQLIAE